MTDNMLFLIFWLLNFIGIQKVNNFETQLKKKWLKSSEAKEASWPGDSNLGNELTK